MTESSKLDEQNSTEESTQTRWRGLLATGEGRVLLTGVGLAIGYLVSVGMYVVFVRPDMRSSLFAMTASHLVAGRAAGISVGYANDLGHDWVISANIIIETFMVLIAYPIFVFSVRRLVVFDPIQSFVVRIESAAERHQGKIRRYGIPGLLLFVMFPFWMTGPTVGCVIGYFLGVRTWLNLTVVLTGTYLAIVLWALALRHLIDSLASVSSYAPIILIVAIIAVAIVGHLLQTDADGGESSEEQPHEKS